MVKQRDYYSILQISTDATTEDIKAAFRRLARQYHPDLNPDNPQTAEQFKQISQAYEALSDPFKRRRYDRELNFSSKDRRSRKSSPEPTRASQNAQDFYLRGIEKGKTKQYQRAVKEYSKAIELDPEFVDAYLKRCEMRYKLGDNQGVLDDCYRVIKIKPSVAKAYYYQGRARHSLGYIQASIDSYSEAIRQEKDYAQAYYYRGISHRDVEDKSLAIEDFQTAAELFRTEGNYNAYRLTRKQINTLSKGSLQLDVAFGWIADLLNNVLTTLLMYFFNPGGGLLPAFARLSKQQAALVGLVYGGSFDLSVTAGSYFLASSASAVGRQFAFVPWQLLVLNLVPFVCLIVLGSFVRLSTRSNGTLATDTFIAGTSLLPLGLSALLLGFMSTSHVVAMISIFMFGLCYSILTLYVNYTQILNFSEAKASFFIPLMLVASLWFYSLTHKIISS